MSTVTLIAAPLGDTQPGRPFDDWDQLSPEARAWVKEQADEENEMVTVVDGDQSADLDGWDVHVTELG